MRNLSKALVALALALGAAGAQAQVQSPTSHRHDGFYLRLDLGLGYMHQKEPQTGGDLEISGAAGEFGVAVGGALQDNLILAGHLFGMSISDPKVSVGGVQQASSLSSSTLVGIGPQLTYYFMPANVYVSGTLALTRLSTRNSGVDGNSEWGGGLQLAVGKEWWVSDDWGLGVAAQLFGSSNKDQGTNAPTISTWGAAVAFSATYN
ncbi:outer membrane beta-barrel protein [Anaeromyxobacter diazotrophicus]|uniref:Outer membrane protein beta-barrel domain-containing protein n=1 Tax=Anaeromyxobacter diazotrophicus TaxID=2590199 RepID=A0A7I9VK93_9BACT|nr:outer membrane beta-barrel protein [Anaeromyxobacter diazotrophicus]GEJ56826.1 hypothetical protein AMYX_15670 [Anaeromyxobacter diazotrophicus]